MNKQLNLVGNNTAVVCNDAAECATVTKIVNAAGYKRTEDYSWDNVLAPGFAYDFELGKFWPKATAQQMGYTIVSAQDFIQANTQ